MVLGSRDSTFSLALRGKCRFHSKVTYRFADPGQIGLVWPLFIHCLYTNSLSHSRWTRLDHSHEAASWDSTGEMLCLPTGTIGFLDYWDLAFWDQGLSPAPKLPYSLISGAPMVSFLLFPESCLTPPWNIENSSLEGTEVFVLALEEPGVLNTQGSSFKGRNEKPVFCPKGWSSHVFKPCDLYGTCVTFQFHFALQIRSWNSFFLSQSIEPITEGVHVLYEEFWCGPVGICS